MTSEVATAFEAVPIVAQLTIGSMLVLLSAKRVRGAHRVESWDAGSLGLAVVLFLVASATNAIEAAMASKPHSFWSALSTLALASLFAMIHAPNRRGGSTPTRVGSANAAERPRV